MIKIIDTSATGLKAQFQGSIATDENGTVGVTWIDETYEYNILNFARSDDHGQTFFKTTVDSTIDWLSSPQIIFEKNNIWISNDLYWEGTGWSLLHKSTDSGNTFTTKELGIRSSSFGSSITADSLGNIFVLWKPFDKWLSCTKFILGNLNDTIITAIPTPSLWLYYGAFNIVADPGGQNLYAVFGGRVDPDSNHIFIYKTYFTKSTDGGRSFSAPIQVETSVDPEVNQLNPFICLWKNKVCIIWSDNRTGFRSVYYTESTDSGVSFSPVIKVSKDYNGLVGYGTEMAGNSEMLNLIWLSVSDSSTEVYFSQKTFQSNTFSIPTVVGDPDFNKFRQEPIGVAIDKEGYSYVLFFDDRVDPFEFYWRVFLSRAKFNLTTVRENYHLSSDYILYQNYPNPFNAITIIKYSIPYGNSEVVTLKVYDPLGKDNINS